MFIIASMIAGLGLFFFGLKSLGQHLKTLSGRPFQRVLGSITRRPWLAIAGGIGTGFLTQSGRTTAFLASSFTQAGLLHLKESMPLVLWANLGCTLIVFAAVLPLDVLVLLLVGLSGAGFAFEYPRHWRSVYGAIFGVALLLLGLGMLSGAAGQFAQSPDMLTALNRVDQWPLLALVLGAGLTFLCQSHMAIVLITVTMAESGVLGYNATLMMIYGAHVGSSLLTYALAGNLRGEPRQVVMIQVYYNLVGAALFVGWFAIDHYLLAEPSLLALAQVFASNPGGVAAFVAIAFNVVTPALLHATQHPLRLLIQARCPATSDERLAKPEYLQEQALNNPEAALLLAEREQLRLFKRLPLYMAIIRDGRDSGTSPRVYHEAHAAVSSAISQFLNELLDQRLQEEQTCLVLNLRNRLELCDTLENVAYSLTTLLQGRCANQPDHELGLQIIESLDVQLMTTIAALEEQDAEEIKLLETMVADRGPAIEQIRKSFFNTADRMSHCDRNRILELTHLYERAAWTLSRLVRLLQST